MTLRRMAPGWLLALGIALLMASGWLASHTMKRSARAKTGKAPVHVAGQVRLPSAAR